MQRGIGWSVTYKNVGFSEGFDDYSTARVRLQMTGGESLGQAAAALEFALEGLYLMRRLSKDSVDGGAVYRT